MQGTDFVIEVQSDLTATACARITSKNVTITSGDGGPYTITRGDNFEKIQDNARSTYNPAMIEVTVAGSQNASVTLENIILDDAGLHEDTKFTQASDGDDKSDNQYRVQDAMVAAYGTGNATAEIILGEGAVLKNFGGMSAVRATGGTALKMLSGSEIYDDEELNHGEGDEEDLGPTGAVWVQNGEFTMEHGAEITDINGRAVYADQGIVDIDGTISNVAYNLNFQNAFQGIAVHLRGGANGTVSGEICDIQQAVTNGSVLHVVDNGNLKISGHVYDITNTNASNRVVNAEGIDTEVTISGNISAITDGYVLYLSNAAEGILEGTISDISGKVVGLVDGSGEPYVGDTEYTNFVMEDGAVITNVTSGRVLEASVSRGSLTMPDKGRDIAPEYRDHVDFTIDGEISEVSSTVYGANLININADVNAFSEYAKTPGEYINCTIGPNARIHDNSVYRIIWTQGGTVDIYGKIYNNNACVYKGSHNCCDALVTMYDGAEIYENNSSNPSRGDWEGDAVFMLGNAKLTMEEGSVIRDNTSSGSASAIYIYNGGQLVMNGGEIYNNHTTSINGGQISYRSGTSWPNVYDSCVQFNSGKIYNNTSEGGYDFVIIGGDPSFTGADNNRERCFTIPSADITSDCSVYYLPVTHQDKDTQENVTDYYGMLLDVQAGTKLGVISKDTKDKKGSLSVLTEVATSYGWTAPFAAFWMQNAPDDSTVSIKMAPSQENQSAPTFNPNLPVYVITHNVGADGYPLSNDSTVQAFRADVATDGTINFKLALKSSAPHGSAVVLVQPTVDYGSMTASAPSTLIGKQDADTTYQIPYSFKYVISENLKNRLLAESLTDAEIQIQLDSSLNVDTSKITFTSDIFTANDITYNNENGTLTIPCRLKTNLSGITNWDTTVAFSATLPGEYFANDESLTASGAFDATISNNAIYVPSNLAITLMKGSATITAIAGSNGSITPSSAEVNYGDSATFTIIPDSGYHIADVKVDGVSVGAVDSYTFSNVTADHTITATFEENSSGGGAQHPDAGDGDDDDDTEEVIDEEAPLAETPWLNTEDHYAYIVGYSEDGTVRPNANITRAEVATIFFRLLTDEARDQFWMTTNNFSDVLPSDWYNTAVSTMVSMGIIQGYEDGTFRPNANITRAEFATIAARFLASGYEVEDELFTDIANHWARESINDAAMAGWINGYEDGTFRPDAAITRAEAVTMVNNVLQRKPDADHMLDSMIKWPDNPESAWYYEAIQEATNSHYYDLFEDAEYETWTALQPNHDWATLEKDWANAHRADSTAL